MKKRSNNRWFYLLGATLLASVAALSFFTLSPPTTTTETAILQTPTARHWQQIGIRPHHGINVPLFSIHSETSAGIGEFSDLIPLISWCKEIGCDIIQLLPLNDTGNISSPYSGLSAYALNPIHLKIASLPQAEMFEELRELQALNSQPRVNYPLLREKKEQFLRSYFAEIGPSITATAAYKQFVDQNPWLNNYAIFKAKKIANDYTSWQEWPETDTHDYSEEIAYHIFVQFLCFVEMEQVHAHAKNKGVLIKGDIPILVDKESAEVWAAPHLFDVYSSAGVPQDPYYSPIGQYWGLPPYNWEAHKEENYRWWKERLRIASQLYDLYRVDHIIGLFRFWSIPEDRSPNEGRYIPSDETTQLKQGEEILTLFLNNSTMLPIAEDIGDMPPKIREVLEKMGIVSTKLMRWEKDDQGYYIPVENYPLASMTTTATHDLPLLEQWWLDYPDEACAYAKMKGWPCGHSLTADQLYEILQDSHASSSLLHINLLQEYIQLIPSMRESDPYETRLNVPGTVADTNWSKKIKPTVEELTSDPELKKKMQQLFSSDAF